MVLPARPMHVPAGLPIDQHTRMELLDVGAANVLNVNARIDNAGSLKKRLGYAPLGTTRLDGTSRSAGFRLLSNGTQPCVIDGAELDSLSPGADSAWVNKFRLPEAAYRHLEVPTVGMGNTGSIEDSVVCGDVFAVTYYFENTSGANTDVYQMVAVLDLATGTVIRRPEAVRTITNSSTTTHLATYSTYIIAFFTDFTNNDIYASYLNTASRATIAAGWTSIGAIATDAAGVHVCVASQSDRVAIVYGNNSGGASRLTVKTLTIAGVVETVTINTSSITPSGPSLSEGGTTLWVAWAEEVAGGPPTVTNFKVIGLNPSSISGAAHATVATVIQTSRAGGQGAGVTWLVSNGTTGGTLYAINENVFASDGINVRSFTTAAGATSALDVTYKFGNSVPVGRPFYRGGRVYMPLASSILEECVLCDVTPPITENFFVWRPVAAPISRGTFVLPSSNPRSRCAVAGTNTYLFAFNVIKAGTSTNGIFGAALVEFDFASPYRWKPASLNGSTFLSGGVTSVYDGRRVCEAAFLCRPPTPTVDVTVAGSQTFSVGRSYVATYEDVDADGNWHVSGVSAPVSTGAITNKKVNLSVQPLTITARTDDPTVPTGSVARIGLWVTKNGNLPPYYRIGTVANDTAVETIAFEDTSAEVDFTSNALLYSTGNLPATNGSSQDHRAPPGLLYHVAYNGMLVGATGKTIYYSSQPIDGEGTWFSPAFSVAGSIDEDVTGMTVQDGSVLIFTRSGIWATAGEPPSDNGGTGGLSTPRKLAVDAGCVNANSILTTGVGTFYKSENTIELLARGLTTTPIGEAVQATLAAYPYISSAVLDTRNGLARFSLASAQQSDGRVGGDGFDLVFDVARGAWQSRDDKLSFTPSQDAAMLYIDGVWRYAWLAASGTVYYERSPGDASAYLDGSSWVTLQYELPAWKLGLQQEQRVYESMLLFERASACGITIEVAHDFGAYAAVDTDKVWSESATVGKRRLPLKTKSQTSAVQFRVKDTPPAVLGTGQGAIFIGISSDIAPKQGSTRATPRLESSLRR